MTETEPSYVAETLEWCNTIRAEKGMEPLERLPKGVVSDAASCPCGKATGLWVYSSYAHPVDNTDNLIISVPDAVSAFVMNFDYGRLPQYEETTA